MKLACFTADGGSHLGVVIGDEVADLTAVDPNVPTDVGGAIAGVGFTMKPPRMLRPGARVRMEIEGIGTIDNPVVAEAR
ncbi:MAG: hypothetical protein ACR2LJ_10415 [Acidimicrobiales bacterium]